MFTLCFSAFSGCSPAPRRYETEDEARDAAARILSRRRRTGHVCSMLERGAAWECTEPADAFMIPDTAGLLSLERVTWECRECGCACETPESARLCCTNNEWFDSEEE